MIIILSRLVFSVLLLSTLVIATTAQASTYYVDRNLPGNDSNTGTSETTPFLTIQRCFNSVVAGDTCLVKNGTYAESVQLRASGSVSLPITIKNYPGHTPVVDGSSLSTTLNGININSDASSPSQKISYIVLSGFEIRNFQQAAIKFGNADHVTIQNNYIHDIGQDAGNSGQGIYGWGIFITIQANRIYNVGDGGNINEHGMYLEGSNYVIVNNLIYYMGAFGIQCKADNYTNHTNFYPSAAYSAFSNALIVNNTIAYSRTAGAMNQWIEEANATIANNTISNNIFYENARISGSASGIRMYCNGTCPTNLTVSHNISYATSGVRTFIMSDGCTSCTFSNNCPSTNGGNCATNPNMNNAPATLSGSPDFHLTTQSTVAIDLGANFSSNAITSDFAGVARPAGNGFDIGAYEFSSSIALVPPRNLKVQ